MRLLGIDPAISCGWCVSEINMEEKTSTLIAYNYFDVERSEYSGDMCIFIQNQVKELFTTYDIDEMVIEDYMFKSGKCQGSHLNLYLRCALHILCREMKKPYYIMSVSNWKSIIAGRSIPTKEMQKYYGKELANKIFIQEALWVRYKIRFPNHVISNKTKKPINMKYDIIDAVAISIAYAYSKYFVNTIHNNVLLIDDVVMHTKKQGYSYE